MKSPLSPSTRVCLVPEHPSFGSMSMRRYWQALMENQKESDDFKLEPIFPSEFAGQNTKRAGKWQRMAIRKISYPWRIRRGFRGEIAHVLDHSWADMLKHVPASALKVATVHDLIPLRYPGGLRPEQVARFRSWVECLKLADVLIADSAYTKSEIEHYLGIHPDKIHVVSLGVDLPAAGKVPRQDTAGKDDPTVFRIGSIGSILRRKNLEILPGALALAARAVPGKIILERVGELLPASLADSIRQVLGNDGLIERGFLPDAEVGKFYHRIDAVVMPSLSEGFGLPVLEAMAYGTPVVCSSTTSLPEVGGDAVLYFDPQSGPELAARLIELSDHNVRERLRTLALARAGEFTWRHCLTAVHGVYRSALAEKKH